MLPSVEAIEEIVALIDKRRETARLGRSALVHSIEEIALTLERFAETEVDNLAAKLARIEHERRLSPVDPSAIPCFGFETAEIRWTKWLASLLDGTCGKPASQITWRAMCRAIADVADDRRAFWIDAGDTLLAAGSVRSELSRGALGRADLVVDHSDAIILIENKLDASWHDGSGDTQAKRYADLAEGLRMERQRRFSELVLLRNNARVSGEGWVVLEYRHLAAALRSCLRDAIQPEMAHAALLDHVPVLVTIKSIEEDLLRLRRDPIPVDLAPVARWHRLRARLEELGTEGVT